MKVHKKHKVQLQENRLFIPLNILFGLIFVVTIILSIVDKYVWQVDWGESNAIDVLCEIIASATFFVGSIIGIAIPLQKEKLYGISSQDFNKLRGKYRYSVALIIVFSIVLAALNGIFLALGLMFACLGVSAISIVFCIYVSAVEVPLMMGQEKSLIKTVKRYVHWQLNETERLPTEGKEVLKYLCCKKTLKATYEILKNDDYEFNKKLILSLLEAQEQQAFDLAKIESKEEQRKIASALRSNVRDILNFNFDLTVIFGDNAKNYSYRITRVLFRLDELSDFSKITRELLVNTTLNYDYVDTQYKKDFIMSVVLPMLLISVTSGDFGFAKAMRRLLSENEIILDEENSLSLIMSLMSLHFYYLCNGAHDVSQELKSKIIEFINFEGVEDNTKIVPWKKLFLQHTEEYKVKLEELLRYFKLSEHNWDVMLRNTGAHFVILSTEYVLQWYLTCLLHSYSVWDFDFDSILVNEDIKYFVKILGGKIFENNQKPQLTEQMKNMAQFYGLREDAFNHFIVCEEQTHKLFNVVNGLHIDDLKSRQRQAHEVDVDELVKKFNEEINQNLANEWGYDSKLEVASESRFMNLLLEKYNEAVNYNEAIVKSILNATYDELAKHVPKTVIVRGKDFDLEIKELLNRNIIATTQNVQFSVGYYIKDGDERKKFSKVIDGVEKVKSKILIGEYIFTDKPLSFKCEFVNVQWRELTPEEVSQKADTYKRADGQYIYEGALISREWLEAFIKEQYFILSLEMRYVINVLPDSIYKIELFPADDSNDT